MAEDLIEQRWVVTGFTITSDKKPGVVFRPIEGDELKPQSHVFDRKRRTWLVGGVYRIYAAPDASRARMTDASYEGLWHDEQAVAVWQTEARAFDVAEKARRNEKTDAKRDLMLERLDPLRKAYWKTSAVGRLAIEVQVLAYLRSTRIVREDD